MKNLNHYKHIFAICFHLAICNFHIFPRFEVPMVEMLIEVW